MKLIRETYDAKPLIVEDTGGKSYFIEGVFLQAELRNRNGRIYPLSVLQREVGRYSNELVREGRALGELGHPDSPQLNLDRVSHLIVSLEQSGNDFIGKAKIMNTPYGNIVKALIDENVRLGVSSRGVGSLKTTSQGNVVDEDFYLTTAADIVADPSAPDAFVRGIMEGREWVWTNGVLSEREIAQYKKELTEAPKKKAAAKKLDEAKVWQKFMESLRVDVCAEGFNDGPPLKFHTNNRAHGGPRFEDLQQRVAKALKCDPKDVKKVYSTYENLQAFSVPRRLEQKAEQLYDAGKLF